jgi:hypothetical protein
MQAEDRLAKLFEKGGITFSTETINTRHGPQILITITSARGLEKDTVGGCYDSVDNGINDCIDRLEEMNRKRSGLVVVK